jgi:cytochrome c oxidase subunit 2
MSNKYRRNGHKPAQRRSAAKARILAFAVVALLVLGAAGYLVAAAFSPRTPPPAANVIDISADMGGFSRSEIRVKAGQSVTVRLTSLDNSSHTDGGGKHQWAVDEVKASVVAPALGSNTVTFTPDRPGEYTFYCDICCGGRANPTMQGKLIVEG